jgi:hypothetical protein
MLFHLIGELLLPVFILMVLVSILSGNPGRTFEKFVKVFFRFVFWLLKVLVAIGLALFALLFVAGVRSFRNRRQQRRSDRERNYPQPRHYQR